MTCFDKLWFSLIAFQFIYVKVLDDSRYIHTLISLFIYGVVSMYLYYKKYVQKS